jgi:hypothetical protein
MQNVTLRVLSTLSSANTQEFGLIVRQSLFLPRVVLSQPMEGLLLMMSLIMSLTSPLYLALPVLLHLDRFSSADHGPSMLGSASRILVWGLLSTRQAGRYGAHLTLEQGAFFSRSTTTVEPVLLELELVLRPSEALHFR